jgi:FkbM family methyltransferase
MPRLRGTVQRLALSRGYRIVAADVGMGMWDRVRLALDDQVGMMFDVGANEGQTATALAWNFPGAAVHSFEPDPDTYEKLCRNTAEYSCVSAHNFAVGRENGSGTLTRTQQSVGNSLLPLEEDLGLGDWTVGTDKVPVPVRRLDDFCADENISRIDILKTDTQGAELDVLIGAGKMLTRDQIRVIQCEVIFRPLYKGQAEFCDIHSFLVERGYHLIGLFNEVRVESQRIGWADAAYA